MVIAPSLRFGLEQMLGGLVDLSVDRKLYFPSEKSGGGSGNARKDPLDRKICVHLLVNETAVKN